MRNLNEAPDRFFFPLGKPVAAPAPMPAPDVIKPFEAGDWLPDGLKEKAAEPVIDPGVWADEQSAFEDWCAKTCPSGDCESVQYQWAQSSEREEWLDSLSPEPPTFYVIPYRGDENTGPYDLTNDLQAWVDKLCGIPV